MEGNTELFKPVHEAGFLVVDNDSFISGHSSSQLVTEKGKANVTFFLPN